MRISFPMRAFAAISIAMLTLVPARAQESAISIGSDKYILYTGGYKADDNFTVNNGNGKSSENYHKIVDGKTGTKWCVIENGTWDHLSVDFHTAKPVIVKGYRITTGDDTGDYPGRNPLVWSLYGRTDINDDWHLIDSRNAASTPADALPAQNTTAKTYTATSNTASYKYYRFVINSLTDGNVFQLAELELFGLYNLSGNSSIENAIVTGISPVYDWTGNPINVSYTVKNLEGTYLTKNTDYTASFSPATIKDVGQYTLTLTGAGNYTGTKEITFNVFKNLSGNGSSYSPYLISSQEDWQTFIQWINNNNSTYGSKIYKLTSDITISEGVGTDENRFRGSFDGDGHTITINNMTEESDFCAPFRFAEDCHIYRLHTTGTVVAGSDLSKGKYRSGLIGGSKGSVSASNCWSSVTITSGLNGDGYHGGLVGMVQDGYTSLANCLFDGTISGANTTSCAGFIGKKDGSQSPYISNSLMAGTLDISVDSKSATFCTNGGSFYNSYYTASYGTQQATDATSLTPEQLKGELGKEWIISNDKVVPVIDIKNMGAGSIVCNSRFDYTGSPIDVTYTVIDMDGMSINSANYTATISPQPVQEWGLYTITATGNANGYYGTVSKTFRVMGKLSGQGTEGNPYTINSADDWNKFADIVEAGESFSNKYVKLMADISVSRMIGLCGSNPFSGTFDGDNHTLTVNIVSTATGTDPNEQGVAPFHYIKSATIKNLTVAGSISSNSQHTGGLIGYAYGMNRITITDCVVTATLTIGANSAGGLIGNYSYGGYNGNARLTNCVFAGTIQSNSDDKRSGIGGLIGDSYGSNYINNCLENGTYHNIEFMNPRCGHNSNNNNFLDTLYYVNAIGNMETNLKEDNGCLRVITHVPSDTIYAVKSIRGHYCYKPAVLSGLKDAYPYNGGNVISLGQALKINLTTLVPGTDYDVTVRDSHNEIVDLADLKQTGHYTLRLTGKGKYGGEVIRPFSIIIGEELSGYLFATEGEGTDKVYLIETEQDLQRLAAYINDGTYGNNAQGMTFKLKNDITLTQEHTPIALTTSDYYIKTFKGTFDGNNKTISNVTINMPDNAMVGFFGYLSDNAVVKDLTLNNCNVTAKSTVGGLIGCIHASSGDASVSNCHVTGTISSRGGHIGGIAGNSEYCTFNRCTFQGSVTSTQSINYAGGITGDAAHTSISFCQNMGSITAEGDRHGGITGYASGSAYLSQCFNSGTVTGTSSVGAIGGQVWESSNMTNCYYAEPNDIKAFGEGSLKYDSEGHGERVYAVTAGAHMGSIIISDQAVYSSTLTDKSYYKNGDLTVSLSPAQVQGTFSIYNCQGGSLSNATTVGGNHTLTVNGQDVVISALFICNALNETDGIDNALAAEIAGNEISFARSFTQNTASTLCLPFDITALSGWGKFYRFTGVSKPGNNAKWTVVMQEPSTTELTANTPYLFMPAATGSIIFSGRVADDFDGTPGITNADDAVSGTWSFNGTYSNIEWIAGNPDLGYVYGFASAPYNGGDYTVSPGDFVMAADGASIAPFRAYLRYNEVAHAPMRGVSSAQKQLPSTLTVVLLGKDGGTTAVGTLDLGTGTVTFDENAWYSIDGRELKERPTQPGIYINGTRKVTIKH